MFLLNDLSNKVSKSNSKSKSEDLWIIQRLSVIKL